MTNDDEPLPIASAVLPDMRAEYTVRDALEITVSASRPLGLDALPSDDADLIESVARNATYNKHKQALQAAALSGNVTILNPLDRMPHTFPMGQQLLCAQIPRDELQRFARGKLRIELTLPELAAPAFVTSARPTCVPSELLALPVDARITYEHSIGGHRGNGTCTAGDYRQEIEATIARQSEGFFTLTEAAQVLADCRTGLDPIETVKRFRLAHSKGELPIHQRGSRFRLEVGETIRDFLDLLEVAELDAWLRASAGYGFPRAAFDTTAAVQVAANEPTPDRGRHVKPPQVFPVQEAEILKAIRQLGYEPKQLPPRRAGKPWVKSAVWRAIGLCQLFASERVFNKAWDRLRASTEIAEQKGL